MTNEELKSKFAAIRCGDKEAFADFYRDFKIPVYTLVCRIVQDRHAAEDVMQELSAVETEALAYVDGSFNLSTGVYGYGGVLLCRDGSIRPLQGHGRDETLRTMRNVAGEIHGSMAAIQAAADAGIASITIFYDYMGIEMWANGQWKTNKEGTRAYKAFIEAIRPRIEIRFQKVAAHTGVRFNELVDQLAKASVGIA